MTARPTRGRAAAVAVVTLGLAAACAAGATAGRDAAAPPVGGYKVVGAFGKEGTASGQLSTAVTGLAAGADGTIYVGDSNLHRVQAFSGAGVYKARWDLAPGEFVADVAVGPTGDVFAATQVGGLVRRFPAGGGAPEDLPTPKSADGVAVDRDGNLYVPTNGDATHAVVRFGKTPTGYDPAAMWAGGMQTPFDAEVSPDGTIYVGDRFGSPPNVKRFDATGKLLGRINLRMQPTAGAGALYGIGVDVDCNLWATNPSQRNLARYTPSGKLITTTTSGDLVGVDIAVGPTGDLYVFDVNTRKIVHFAEDRSKPQPAVLVGPVAVVQTPKGPAVRVRYSLPTVSCPAEIRAVATLAGKGLILKAAGLRIAAARTTTIDFALPRAVAARLAGTRAAATFTIVLSTNGRTTTQARSVTVAVPR